MEDDIFYDLFGEEGLLTPESSTGSTDQDSGFGSPFGSSFDDASPQSLTWDAADPHGELWGSILDELPSDIDITDDSDSNAEQQQQQPLSDDDFLTSLLSADNGKFNEMLSSSTQVLEEGNALDFNSNNTMNWNLDWEVLDNHKQLPVSMDCTTTANSINNSIISNNQSVVEHDIPVSVVDENDFTKLLQYQYNFNDTNNPSEVQSPTSKDIQPIKAPWVVKAASSDIKSNFQISSNIFSMIQNISDEKTSPDVDGNSICNTVRGAKPSVANGKDYASHPSRTDHDYAERDTTHITQPASVSQGIGPGLTFTAEEKKLLQMENLKLPEGVALTKDEEKVLKKVRRKIRNKQSAMESRRKRKEYIHNLEHRVKYCTDLNNDLKKKVDTLSKENKSLINQVKLMKEFIAESFKQTRAVSTGTCLAVLLLSFALFILPFNPSHYFDSKPETIPTESPSPQVTFRSRTLLQVDDHTDYSYENEFINMSFPMAFNDYSYEPFESVKIHLDNIDGTIVDYNLKTNISMYWHQNFTWYSVLSNLGSDHYVTS